MRMKAICEPLHSCAIGEDVFLEDPVSDSVEQDLDLEMGLSQLGGNGPQLVNQPHLENGPQLVRQKWASTWKWASTQK